VVAKQADGPDFVAATLVAIAETAMSDPAGSSTSGESGMADASVITTVLVYAESRHAITAVNARTGLWSD